MEEDVGSEEEDDSSRDSCDSFSTHGNKSETNKPGSIDESTFVMIDGPPTPNSIKFKKLI